MVGQVILLNSLLKGFSPVNNADDYAEHVHVEKKHLVKSSTRVFSALHS